MTYYDIVYNNCQAGKFCRIASDRNNTVIINSIANESGGTILVVKVLTGIYQLSAAVTMKPILVVLLWSAIFLAGCVSDNAVITQDDEPDWEQVESPIGCGNASCMSLDEEGNIYAGLVYSTIYAGGISAPVQYTGERTTILVSRDNGDSWESTGFRGIEIESIAAGRDGKVFAVYCNFQCYIHRSNDRGITWEEIGSISGCSFCCRMVTDSEGWIYIHACNEGLYRSADEGDTWAEIYEDRVSCITFDSEDRIYIGTSNGLYRSDTRGDSWCCVDTTVAGHKYINSLAIDVDSRIFAGAVSPGPQGGLYRSQDDGDTWKKLNVQEDPYSPSEIIITPDNTIFAAYKSGLYRSEDNGDSWTIVHSGYLWIRSMLTDSDGDIFVLTNESVYRSRDNGDDWTIIGLPHGYITDIAIDSSGTWWAGFSGGGVYYSSDNFSSWNQFNAGLKNIEVTSLAITDAGVIITGTSTGIYRSPTTYADWSYIGPDSLAVTELSIGQTGCILTGTEQNGVFLSRDSGDTWVNTGMEGYNITSLLADNNGDLFAGADFGGVFRYAGDGIVWDQLNEGLEDLRINTLAIGPTGRLYAGTRDGVFLFDADSRRWDNLGLGKHRIRAIYIDNGGNIFLGTSSGIFTKSPDLSQWESMNRGLNIPVVRFLLVGPDDHLYAIYRNIYRSTKAIN